MSRLAVVLLLAGSVAGSLPVSAQEPPANPEGFAEAIDVRVVNLEAVVTDRRGRPVQGLTAADFRLLVDGNEVPIDYFTEVVEGEAADPAPSAPGTTASSALPAPVSGRVGRSYLVFLDDSFSIAAQRNQVLNQVEKSLHLLGHEDRMALVAFDGMGLVQVCGWTGDHAALKTAFDRARQRPALGNFVLAERRSDKDQLELIRDALTEDGPRAEGGGGQFDALLAGAATRVTNDKHYSGLSQVAAAAAAGLRAFPPPPSGRKIFLLLSGGWSEPQLFLPLVRDANRLGYTIYPVDVQGTDPLGIQDMADHRLHSLEESTVTIQERRGHDTLELLARGTGGKASLNSVRFDAFARAVEDTSSYYWLGFSPAWKADDKNHAIRLEARRPGITVRARRSYTDLSPDTEEALRTESLLLFGTEGEGRPNLQVEMGTPRRAGRGLMELPVTVMIPVDSLQLERLGAFWIVEGRLAMGALDKWGGRSELPVVALRLELMEQPKPGGLARYRTTLKLRRGQQKVVFRFIPKAGGLFWRELELRPEDAG